MLLWVLRGLFVMLTAAVGFSLVGERTVEWTLSYRIGFMLAAIVLSVVVVILDMSLPRKSLAALSGAFLGLLVGMVAAYGIGLVFDLIIEVWSPGLTGSSAVQAVKLIIGIIACFFSISFVLQTKDDIRFVIPYVEFAKESRGGRPLLLDTSVIIDGRVADLCETHIFDSELVIPRFVLQELQTIADSGDRLKRNRGRRGLDMLNKLQTNERVRIRITEGRLPNVEDSAGVDQKLVELARTMDGRVVTNDYNLGKIASLRGVPVINLNDLANALKPVVLPGETVTVKIVKPGEEAGQGVGYLEDGTMVVAENSRDKVSQEVTLAVTSVLQTSAGRMIFGRPDGMPPRRSDRRH